MVDAKNASLECIDFQVIIWVSAHHVLQEGSSNTLLTHVSCAVRGNIKQKMLCPHHHKRVNFVRKAIALLSTIDLAQHVQKGHIRIRRTFQA